MTVHVSRDGAVGRVVLDRPEVGNAIDRDIADRLFEAMQRLESDRQVRVVHLAAAGDDFCAGADYLAMARLMDESPDAQRQDAEAIGRVFLAVRALMKPVVCSIRGRALGEGLALALACDVVLARSDAEFGFPEVRIGFVPAVAMTMLRRTIGEKRAADLVLTGRIVDADEAERIGLVSRALPEITYEDAVSGVVTGLTRSSPTSLALTKWLLYKLDSLSFEDGIAAGVVTNVEARSTEDFRANLRQMRDGQGNG